MARKINKVFLYGNVGQEPEVHQMNDGTKVANFSLATSSGGYQKANGQQVPEETQWHRIVAWRSLAEVTQNFIHRGSSIIVEGSIRYRSYDNQQGQKITVTEILADNITLTGAPQAQQQQYQAPQFGAPQMGGAPRFQQAPQMPPQMPPQMAAPAPQMPPQQRPAQQAANVQQPAQPTPPVQYQQAPQQYPQNAPAPGYAQQAPAFAPGDDLPF